MHNIQTKHIEAMRNLLFEEFGIHVSDLKAGNIVPKLSKLLLNEKYENADDFFLFLKDFSAAKIIIANILRQIIHFSFGKKIILILYLKMCRNKNKHRYLVCGFFNGEEAYSIAMTLLDRV